MQPDTAKIARAAPRPLQTAWTFPTATQYLDGNNTSMQSLSFGSYAYGLCGTRSSVLMFIQSWRQWQLKQNHSMVWCLHAERSIRLT